MPRSLLQFALGRVAAAINHRHPSISERMAADGEADFLIEPIDLPFRFLLCFRRSGPTLRLHSKQEPVTSTASVRGPFLVLLQLLEGKLDGDALFFSRVISFDGDTGAVLALRNAIENGGVELVRDLTEPLGPLRGPARFLAERLSALMRKASDDMETLRLALVGPVERTLARHAAEIKSLQADVLSLRCDKSRASQPSRPASGGPVR